MIRPGCAVVVTGAGAVPAAALAVLRGADAVYATEPVDGIPPVPPVDELLAAAGERAVVLLCAAGDEPSAAALRDAGAPVFAPPAGSGVLAAAAVMDRLRSPGGCPWDAEQTHQSLRRYLVEETYELLDAIDGGDRAALREELGDVLLQVLFHARLATEHPDDPFTVDDVAAALVTKLVDRHRHVFGDGDDRVTDARSQELRWDELKQVEKRRESCLDGVAFGQPAAALAAKLVSRATKAGLPADRLPDTGLFGAVAARAAQGADPEDELRAAALEFAGRVRAAEAAARAAGSPDTWPDSYSAR